MEKQSLRKPDEREVYLARLSVAIEIGFEIEKALC